MNTAERTQPIEILLVEDNSGDVRLMQEALKDSRVPTNLHVVTDGEMASTFLRRDGQGDEVRPDMVLLDLNLPKKDGREVLAEIKTDPNLKCIPVVVLTCSQYDKDILQAYNLHANSYITKPESLVRFIEVVRAIEHFWLTILRLPPRNE